ncbi:ApaG domain [Pantoea sp. SoEX]|nr:ApaG domain [Pantoea sp. SoEX]
MDKYSVKLLNRYLLITDGNVKKVEIHGKYILGKQPYITSGI